MMENYGGFVQVLLYELIAKLTSGLPPAIHLTLKQ